MQCHSIELSELHKSVHLSAEVPQTNRFLRFKEEFLKQNVMLIPIVSEMFMSSFYSTIIGFRL